jgi:hypothetical protein
MTAAYLHARTPARAQFGKTPHEGFEKLKPNLPHLQEIGCRAFVLIEDHNPKVNVRSIECVLIGYTPRCRAYRCWQRSTGKIFNSANVRFIEHGQTEQVHFNKTLVAEQLARAPPTSTATADSVPDDQSSPDPVMTTSVPPAIDEPAPFVDAPPPPLPAPPVLPLSSPPLRRSTRTCAPRLNTVQLASEDVNAEDDGELEILRDNEEVIAATPEDDDGVETALLAQISAYTAENPINVEYLDDPHNYTEAMAAPDAA